jgi:sigma-E factor negative regulatory protein RseC
MGKPGENIEHPGVIERIEGKKIWVSIMPQSACGNCHSKSYCGMAEMEDKIVEVDSLEDNRTYDVGQKVIVQLRKSLGYKALLLGYLLPFLIIFLTLIITLAITSNELFSALISISVVVPYYYVLYLNREKIRSSFRFFITGSFLH